MKNHLRPNTRFIVAAGALTMVLAGCTMSGEMSKPKMSKDVKTSHAHIGHVMASWKDTPEKIGLLETAEDEVEIAITHGELAVSKPGNLASIKLHAGHVLHAVAPKIEKKGPGKGYGVKKAAAGVSKHIGFASAPAGVTKNVLAHSAHVQTSATNVVIWSDDVIALVKKIKSAQSVGAALPLAKEMLAITKIMKNGKDANGDGKITWVDGEGGLKEVRKHMGFMLKGEGLSS